MLNPLSFQFNLFRLSQLRGKKEGWQYSQKFKYLPSPILIDYSDGVRTKIYNIFNKLFSLYFICFC